VVRSRPDESFPQNRLLAAQSLEMGLPLIGNDAIFDRYGVERIW
jgi:PIN domain nuclease of toxin-antitoxin system